MISVGEMALPLSLGDRGQDTQVYRSIYCTVICSPAVKLNSWQALLCASESVNIIKDVWCASVAFFVGMACIKRSYGVLPRLGPEVHVHL